MEFKLFFKGLDNYCSIYSDDSKSLPKVCGLHHLDLARKELGINLPAERFSDTIKAFQGNIDFVLTEQQARQASSCKNIFDYEPTVFIETNAYRGNRFLNKYLKLGFDVQKNQETGEVLSFQFKYVPDKEAILSDWFEAGCPTRWGFDYEKDQEAIDLENN